MERERKPKTIITDKKTQQDTFPSLTDNMSNKTLGISNPAFDADASALGTSGVYKPLNSNGAHHSKDKHKDNEDKSQDEIKSVVENTDRRTPSKANDHISESVEEHVLKSDGQDRAIPTAQVVPRVLPVQSGSASPDVTDVDSVAINIRDDATVTLDVNDAKPPSVAINLEQQRMKKGVKKKNSLAESFEKVKIPPPEELDTK